MEFIEIKDTASGHLQLDKAGEYVVFFRNLSGKITVDIQAKGVKVDIFGVYTGNKSQNYSVETIQHHRASHSSSNLLIKGVFDDSANFRYKGMIRIEPEARQTHAYQKNQNLVLSPQASVESKPYLEILADDVFCTHGSTTGKPDEGQIFYLESRGLDKKSARQLLVEGFIGEVYDKVKENFPSFQHGLQST